MKLLYLSIKNIIFLLIISSFFSRSLPVGASKIDEENRNQKNLTEQKFENYLKKIPEDEYLIGNSDVIKISVSPFYYPELEGVYAVDESGTISVPRLKRIYVKGLTISELTKLLNKSYKEYVKFPEVEVNLVKYRPIKIFVKGEVEQPGQYTLEGSVSPLFSTNPDSVSDKNFYFPELIDALRTAGGINTFSDLENIQIVRNDSISNGGGKKTATIDLKKTIFSKTINTNLRIYDGDIIFVPRLAEPNPALLSNELNVNINPQFINVVITGRVRFPGPYKMIKLTTLNEALDYAGGAKIIKGKVTFLRMSNTGSVEKRVFSLSKRAKRGSYKNPFLRNRDSIYVGDNFISATNEVVTDLTQPLRGIISAYGIYNIFADD